MFNLFRRCPSRFFFLACGILDDFGLANESLQSFLDGSCWSRCWLCHGYGIFASVFFSPLPGQPWPPIPKDHHMFFTIDLWRLRFFFVHSGNQRWLENSLISSSVRWVFPWNTGTPPLVEDVPSANCLIFHWLAEKSSIYRWVCQLIMYNFQWIFQQTNRPWVLGPLGPLQIGVAMDTGTPMPMQRGSMTGHALSWWVLFTRHSNPKS